MRVYLRSQTAFINFWPELSGAASGQPSGMTVQKVDTAVVFIDPQNDVLSEQGIELRGRRRECYREQHA